MMITSDTVQYVHSSMSLPCKPIDFSGFVNLKYFRLKPIAYHRRKVGQISATFERTAGVKDTKERRTIKNNNVSYPKDVNESLCEEQIPGRRGDAIMELTSVATTSLAGEKQGKNIDGTNNCGENHVPVDALNLGRLMEGNMLYRQIYVIRSYEVGVHRTASIETLMSFLQETAMNHMRSVGIGGEGFGTSHEMSRRNLIWIISLMQVQVDRYPSWCDIVEVDSWITPSGKNAFIRRDWLVRDYRTGHILTRATSTWGMMNSETRRLSKIPDEVTGEIHPYILERVPAIVAEDTKKLFKLDDETGQYIRSDLRPKQSDLDMNQHVNNVKYVGWILESVPAPILKSNELVNIILEYRRECGQTDVLKSLTSCIEAHDASEINYSSKSLTHTSSHCMNLLRMQSDGREILRARTDWKPKTNQDSTFLF
eukprot:Gb_22117 [translate_table: standard]